MQPNKDFIKQGAIVWVIDRKRVRDGIGPTRAKLNFVSPGDWCSVVGSRGTYHVNDLFETEAEAIAAWCRRTQAEMASEVARHNRIIARLQPGINAAQQAEKAAS